MSQITDLENKVREQGERISKLEEALAGKKGGKGKTKKTEETAPAADEAGGTGTELGDKLED